MEIWRHTFDRSTLSANNSLSVMSSFFKRSLNAWLVGARIVLVADTSLRSLNKEDAWHGGTYHHASCMSKSETASRRYNSQLTCRARFKTERKGFIRASPTVSKCPGNHSPTPIFVSRWLIVVFKEGTTRAVAANAPDMERRVTTHVVKKYTSRPFLTR